MSKVLVVLAHPHTDVRSLSMEVYEKFIEEYRLQHPDDDIIIRDLFAQPFPAMDNTTFIAIAKQHHIYVHHIFHNIHKEVNTNNVLDQDYGDK